MKNRTRNILMTISGMLLLTAFLLHLLNVSGPYKNLALVAAAIIAGVPTVLKAVQQIGMRSFSIELLVSVAVIGALIIGEYSEAAIVTFLFLFGAFLEARTLEKARASLKSLLQMAPQEATVLVNGTRKQVSAEEVQVGDRVIILSGGKFPVDGTIVSGNGHVNEANITGESVPVKKGLNETVFSSTILDRGYMEIIAEKVGEDTAFAKILELVEEAQEGKAKTQRYLEKFASFYTPGILLLSAIVFLITRDVHLTLTFLVIACPGALVISAPVSIVAGIGNGAKNGILIKGGHIMENLSKINAMVFDKTGTLTQGKPEVTAIQSYGISEKALLKIAAEAEMASEHHLGTAIIDKALKEGINPLRTPEEAEIQNGGLRARIKDKNLFVGNRMFLTNNHIPISWEAEEYALTQEEKGCTAVFVASEKRVLGVIAIMDQIRENAFGTLQQLRENGIQHMVMLTGDNKRAAYKVAAQLGIDQVFSELLPEEKVGKVQGCMKKGVQMAMVGDGINDAPAIAAANVGIAMGGAATAATMETADVVLMGGNISKLAYAQQLARATVRNMKENMLFSVGVVFLLLFGVLTGYVRLASGMFIHELSVLLVILNAIRLVRFPSYQLNLRKWVLQLREHSLFSAIPKYSGRMPVYQFNGCKTNSLEDFRECSKC